MVAFRGRHKLGFGCWMTVCCIRLSTFCTLTYAGRGLGWRKVLLHILSHYWRDVFQRYVNLHRTMMRMGIYFRVPLVR